MPDEIQKEAEALCVAICDYIDGRGVGKSLPLTMALCWALAREIAAYPPDIQDKVMQRSILEVQATVQQYSEYGLGATVQISSVH